MVTLCMVLLPVILFRFISDRLKIELPKTKSIFAFVYATNNASSFVLYAMVLIETSDNPFTFDNRSTELSPVLKENNPCFFGHYDRT